jgi:hypothetical protein
MSLHPTDGARFLLELESLEGGGARYRATIYMPAAEAGYAVAASATGEVAIEPAPASAAIPDEAAAMLRAIARSVARHAVGDDPPAWPRRVLRWRKLAR